MQEVLDEARDLAEREHEMGKKEPVGTIRDVTDPSAFSPPCAFGDSLLDRVAAAHQEG